MNPDEILNGMEKVANHIKWRNIPFSSPYTLVKKGRLE
ncbi:hypothetical protein SAMN05421852_10440 [Thermoflavimicrobium dichotomicum]|uniref:Uncharacterized protein n=1 Tax=Thermoflavimicrobium dichotomicum TaxID=46223 RepID=A0A1I3N8J7_9BACL|nr:hypothetical protein SAMN05421852_10440 [Thermoflavimicrobium dichotomicum]